ncbi:MAG: hypothetical protein QNK24_12975 [Desulfuromusa sp.]|nr:hypothetical protein [Desulfuromusa sp.]
MKSRISLVLSAFLAIILLLGGCSTSRMTSAWKQEGYTGKSVNMLVIGVTARETRRQIFESVITEKLKARGVNAIPSYTVFTNEELNRQAVIDYAKQENIDSVIVTKVLDSETYNQRVSYVTGGPSTRNPYYRGYNGWYNDYRYSQRSVVTYDTNIILTNLETNLYLLEGESMVWSTLSEVESSDNDGADIDDLSNTIINQMVSDELI